MWIHLEKKLEKCKDLFFKMSPCSEGFIGKLFQMFTESMIEKKFFFSSLRERRHHENDSKIWENSIKTKTTYQFLWNYVNNIYKLKIRKEKIAKY